VHNSFREQGIKLKIEKGFKSQQNQNKNATKSKQKRNKIKTKTQQNHDLV